MSPLEPALDVFLSHARIEKGLAANSVDAYGRDLRRYLLSDLIRRVALEIARGLRGEPLLNPLTITGVKRDVVVPSPNWP